MHATKNLTMNCTIISAVNDEFVLNSCLLSSPDIGSVSAVILQKGYSDAQTAYNAAILQSTTDLLIFVHQDVYLPKGWFASIEGTLAALSNMDPNWGVLGVWGVKNSGDFSGYLYCNAAGRILGDQLVGFEEVRTLDEVLLIVRKSSGLRFDKALKGFHMYGSDLCLEASRRGFKCYSISALCIHNTSNYTFLPRQFWQAYLYMRRKWRVQLPIVTSCITITFWCWPMIRWNLVRFGQFFLRKLKFRKRVRDPGELYQCLSKQLLEAQKD